MDDDDYSRAGMPKRILVAAVSGGIAYVIVASLLGVSALRPTAVEGPGPYVAMGSGLLVFVIVLLRMARGSWNREHVDRLLSIDDD